MKKNKTSKKVLIFSFSVVFIFTVAVLVLNFFDHTVDSILIENFYKFFGFELLATASIRVGKTIFGTSEGTNTDGTFSDNTETIYSDRKSEDTTINF